MKNLKDQLAGIAALVAAVVAIGGGFATYGKLTEKINVLESRSTTDYSAQIAVMEEKIAKLSKSSQVLCISHLPQVASFADTHLLISKKLNKGVTNIAVRSLTKQERVKEIARMMSGKKIEDEALILADKMIK